MICIHHNKDLDGFTSGAIVKHKYPDAKLIGWDYKDPLPDFDQFKGERVIMIDVSFPVDKIQELAAVCKHLTIIDHHISFFKEMLKTYRPEEHGKPESFTRFMHHVSENILYVYENGKAACEIGWKYFFPEEPLPVAVKLLGMYDTWREFGTDNWNEYILPFQYYMRLACTSPETFDTEWFVATTLGTKYKDAIQTGRYIVKYQEEQDMLACQRSAFEVEPFHGLRAVCLNTRFFSSLTMKSVYDPERHDIMVGFEYTGDKWSVSLRSDKPDVDVSVIAKSRGGGGHKAAAGFECESFDEIFLPEAVCTT